MKIGTPGDKGKWTYLRVISVLSIRLPQVIPCEYICYSGYNLPMTRAMVQQECNHSHRCRYDTGSVSWSTVEKWNPL